MPATDAQKLLDRYPGMPLFTLPEAVGGKIPLAWLLDRVLGLKSFSVGGARLFEHQPLVIVAQKNTSSNDVKKLAEDVRALVKEKIGIEIEPEVKVL